MCSEFLNFILGLEGNKILGWCKSNCGFYIVETCHLILEYILNKCGYVTQHFNVYFLVYSFFANDLSLAVYFIFILAYGNDIRQKANLSDFLT